MGNFKRFLQETITDADQILSEKSINVADMSPAQHKNLRQNEVAATQWHKDHPVHSDNIINHYNQATAEEKHAGHSWYSDAHHMTHVIAKDTGTPMHTMAGLVANYSPQTHWHTNIMTASKVAREKTAMGGKGSGVFASGQQKDVAHRMLHGEHYDTALVGQKVKAFAHLIEHGGNKDESKPQVVVDRHAYSVAAGARLTDAAFQQAKLKSKKGYNHVVGAYHEAAQKLSEQHGMKIHPHQVQATTWLVRQRLNSEDEVSSSNSSKTQKAAAKGKAKWNDYAGEHHPSIIGKEPGTGYNS